MSGKQASPNAIRIFWIADVVVLVCSLSMAIFGIYMFRLDLLQTIEARGAPPIGVIIIRNNVVQRRYADRVIWERLFEKSPVYSGDLVRAASFSAATILVDEHQISLDENTLIRIQRSGDANWALSVELREGNLSVSTSSGERESSHPGLMLNLMGRQVQVESGTTLNAEIGNEGMILKVNKGNAVLVEDGQRSELGEGAMIAKDKNGSERKVPAAVVTSLKPNARYLKSADEPLPVDFGWNSVNIEDKKNVRLEIASNKNFTKDFRVISSLDNHALAAFNDGVWYWRLSFDGRVLSSGQITVADASGPQLLSPVKDSVFRYFSELPQIRFQWSQKNGASHYIAEISRTTDFNEPQISKQTASSSFVQAGLEPGKWFWRVLPIFPSTYEGNAVHSIIGSFTIEKTEDPHAAAIEIPQAVLAEKIAESKAAPVAAIITTPAAVTAVRTASANTAPGGYYTVLPGDTLGRIAGRSYGDPFQWPRIAEANKLANPDLIFIDQVLLIP